jgi:hydrogenase maturation protease
LNRRQAASHREEAGYLLLIGIGNSLRSDDGAGIVAAERLHQAWKRSAYPHRLLTVHQLLPELAEELADPLVQAVLFIDAAADSTGQPSADAGANERRAAAQPGYSLYPVIPSEGNRLFTHQVSPAMLLAYTHTLYDKRLPAWVLALPGMNFELGGDFSQQITTTLDQIDIAATQIWDIIWRRASEST